MASFVQKREKFWDFVVQFFLFFCLRMYANLNLPPLPTCTQSYEFGLTLPLPFVRTYYVDDPLPIKTPEGLVF